MFDFHPYCTIFSHRQDSRKIVEMHCLIYSIVVTHTNYFRSPSKQLIAPFGAVLLCLETQLIY
jgi:hypothetical protein